jgi:2,3-bisphosphoglycerate-dependent phosphoglycerate mutase
MKKRKKLHIYLFRHGKTTYNTKGIFTGWKDPKLTKQGIKDSKVIARKLKDTTFEVAFHTSLSRSKDTLKYVLKYHPECEKIMEDNRMIERSYGILEGLPHKWFIEKVGKREFDLKVYGDVIGEIAPKLREKVVSDLGYQEYNQIHRGWNTPPPYGESFKMVEKRVRKFIKYLKKYMRKHQVNAAISAHGNSIRLFRHIMEKAAVKETCSWFIPYDKVFEYEIKA